MIGNDNSPEKAHLKKLPIKSFVVASGDIIGGLVYVMDKPLGIEEGMIGISVQSPQYRKFIGEKIASLKEGYDNPLALKTTFESEETKLKILIKNAKTPEEKKIAKTQLTALTRQYQSDLKLQQRFKKIYSDKSNNFYRVALDDQINMLLNDKEHRKKRRPFASKDLTRIFFKFSKLHQVTSFQTYYQNVGMGGLLFEAYKTELGIKNSEHFSSQIGKLMKNGDKAYMIKQDGKMILGGTGPGVSKILKTGSGKKIQPLMNPFIIAATGGLSALAFGLTLLGWRAFYLNKNRRAAANADAIVETVATKMASNRGFESQEIDTIEGTYKNNELKIATIVTWSPGCRDLTGRIAGGKKDLTNVAVSVDKNGIPHKVDKKGNIIRAKEVNEDGKILSYEKIKKNGDRKEVSKQQYDKSMAVSDDSIAGLGESLITIISAGDRDALGKAGQNKAIRPIDPPINGKTHQFFGIDFGKAYKTQNHIVDSLSDDFTFENPKSLQQRFANISMLYDNPLRERMQGVYLMAALRGKLTDPLKSQIADEYLTSDPSFAQKLRDYPQSVGGIDSDLNLVKDQIKQYTELAKASINPDQKEEYFQHARRLAEMAYLAKDTDEKILEVFKDRMLLLPSQIDVLENLEKLTANKVYGASSDKTVRLNHLRVEKEDRVAWQLKEKEGTFTLVCEEKKDLAKIQAKLRSIDLNPTVNAFLYNAEIVNGKIQIQVTGQQLNKLQKHLTEEKIAAGRNIPAFRTSEERKDFHDNLKRNRTNVPMTVLSDVPELYVVPKSLDEDTSAWKKTNPTFAFQAQKAKQQHDISPAPAPAPSKNNSSSKLH